MSRLVPGELLGKRITVSRTVAEELHARLLHKYKLARPHRLEHASFIARFQTWLLDNPPNPSSIPSRGDAVIKEAVSTKAKLIENRIFSEANSAPFIKHVSRRVYRNPTNSKGKCRLSKVPLYLYRYWCDRCGDDEFETVAAPTAQQVVDHSRAHDVELISIWKRPSDGAFFSDHFHGSSRQKINPPWKAANSTIEFIRNLIPAGNIHPTDPTALKCCHPSCAFKLHPKHGLSSPKLRTVFYNSLGRHEKECVCRPVPDCEIFTVGDS